MYMYLLEVVEAKVVGRPSETIGIRSITDIGQVESVPVLGRIFPSAPLPAAAAFRRPLGQVSLMIGMKNRELHCTDGLSYGSLRLCKTRFSPGGVLTGFSPELEATPRRFLSKVVGLPQDSSVPRRVEAAPKVCLKTREVAGRRPWKPCREKTSSSREHEHHLRRSPRRGSPQCREDAIRSEIESHFQGQIEGREEDCTCSSMGFLQAKASEGRRHRDEHTINNCVKKKRRIRTEYIPTTRRAKGLIKPSNYFFFFFLI